jgi:hypothetical protein
VLFVLAGREAERVADTVVRSDGGTDLGVGGLLGRSREQRTRRRRRASTRAANDAMDAAEVDARRRWPITVADDDSGTVRGILEGVGVGFDAADEAADTVDPTVPVADADRLLDRVPRDRRPGDGGVGASAGRLTFPQERNRRNGPGST